MNGVEFIIKETKFNNSQYFRKNKGSIPDVPKNLMNLLYDFSTRTKGLEGGTFSLNDALPLLTKIKDEEKAKIRVLKQKEKSGFVLVGSLTLIGTIIISIIVFIIIGNIIM